jgi:hypothetical protein
MSWISRIANVFRRERIASDLDEELRFHVAERTEEFVRDGMSRGEAELRARRQLGNTLLLRDSSYEAKAAAWLDTTLRDFQFGLRMLRKHPGFALMGMMILALGIGATTVVFGMINAMLLRPLPYPNPDQLAPKGTPGILLRLEKGEPLILEHGLVHDGWDEHGGGQQRHPRKRVSRHRRFLSAS